MINWLEFPKEYIELALAPYMEMPKGEHPFVMQHHWRGRSVHVDWRMKANGYLVGWTILDNPKGTPKVDSLEDAAKALKIVPFRFKAENKNIGRRAETKARQPLEWLKVHGVTKPGEVGATKENIGVIYIFEKGKVIFGVQKPYFHEYFIKSETGNFFPKGEWVRIVVRRVRVPVLDPETKKPLKKREVMWRVLIPSTQEPYAISKRAMQRNYKPPKSNPYPFPLEWTKKNFPEQFKKWKEWIEGKKAEKTCRNCIEFESCTDPETLANPDRIACNNWRPKEPCECSSARFTLHFNSWMGQFVVRGQPRREWYLRLDDRGKGDIRSFFFPRDPLYFEPVSAEDEGRVDRKWFNFEGKIPPRTKYNPNKKIPAIMKIIDSGKVEIDSRTENGIEIIDLKFKGKKLKGKWRLIQEEKGASTFSFEKLNEQLGKITFVLQRHWIPRKGIVKSPKFPEDFVHHWDIRLSSGIEWNLYKNPTKVAVEEPIRARKKQYSPEKIKPWMEISKPHKFMLVGPLPTYVDPLDKGKVEIFNMSPTFISMKLHGSKLKGYFIWKKTETDQVFMKSKLPKTEEKSDNDEIEETFKEVLKALKKEEETKKERKEKDEEEEG